MRNKTSLFLLLWVILLAFASVVSAQTITNPSFEDGLNGWTTYTYTPGEQGIGVEPIVACTDPGCPFYFLDTSVPPDGQYVCGIAASESNGNGGVYQTFNWNGGPTVITVTGRNYSETYTGNYPNLVRMGLVPGYSSDRNDVTEWVTFPQSYGWSDEQLAVPDSGAYTLFIESYQPTLDGDKIALWDNVRVGLPVTITNGPDITPDPLHPETSATVTWTTDVPSTSALDYGPTETYGQHGISEGLTTFHTITITGLTHSRTYHCRVTSVSGDYRADSTDQVFTTPIQMMDLNVSLSPDHLTGYVTWQTDVPTDGQVEYWSDPEAHQTISDAAPRGTEHQVILDLKDGREYHFIATSHGSSPYTSISSSGKFLTLPVPGNSLMNGGFEDTIAGEHSLYPWVQYTTDTGVPSYQPIDGLIGPYPLGGGAAWNPLGSSVGIQAYNGSYFLGTAAQFAYKNGGVFQQINVMPNQYYTLSVRYITYRWGGGDGYDAVRIGVDPTGGVDWSSPNVEWRTVFSDTNNNLWHTASLTMIGGAGGLATVFVDFHQQYSLQYHIAAVDAVSFEPPAPVTIGALKSSQTSLGAILASKVVTYVSPTPVWYNSSQYVKAYVEEDDRSSGVAVLFPLSGSDIPVAGDRLTVTGALAEYNKEATLVAECWNLDQGPLDPDTGNPLGYELPSPFGLSQSMIGTTAVNQPPMFSHNAGLCTVGLRVRMCGKVTWVSEEGVSGDVTAYIDDGGKVADAGGLGTGVRVYLPGKAGGVFVGDYVVATGVLGIDFINPDNWPDPSDYYAYSLFINSPNDWTVTPGS